MGRVWPVPVALICVLGSVWTAAALGGGAMSLDTYEKGPITPASPAETPTIGTEQRIGDIPGLTVTTPAPDWIQPGLRLTYYTMSGSLPNAPP